MFEFIRNNRRFLQFVLLIMILPSFVFFGIQGYNRVGADDALASIGQQQVTQAELDQAMREQLERIKQQFGQQIDTKVFDTAPARQALLDRLINQKVVALEAQKSNLTTSDAKLRETLLNIPGVVQDGNVDLEQYKRVAAAQGMSIEGFESRIRSDLATQQFSTTVANTVVVPQALLQSLSIEQSRTRSVQLLAIKAEQFTQQVKIDPAALQAYYEANKSQYQISERAKFEFVVFDQQAVAQTLSVTDDDLKKYYEENKHRFGAAEERKASHILIKTESSSSATQVQAAKEKALAIEAKLKKDPSQFAKLAQENSDDPGSKSQGGDLGFFKRESMVKPFSDAAFGMKEGEISAPVKSDFGWHIIRVTGVKAANVKPFSEVSKTLEQELKNQQAAKKFAEQTEQFSNLVYEQADSFKAVADKFKLSIRTQEGMNKETMSAAKPQGGEVLFNDKLAAALFSEDSIKGRKNTEAVEVAKGRLVSARLLDYTPSKTLTLEEVKSSVVAQVQRAESLKLAQNAGLEKLKQLSTDPNQVTQGLEAIKKVSVLKPEGYTPEAIKAILKANTQTLPVWAGAEIPNIGYGLYKISEVGGEPTLDAAQKQQLEANLRRAYNDSELQAVLSVLRDKHGVKTLRKPDALSTSKAP